VAAHGARDYRSCFDYSGEIIGVDSVLSPIKFSPIAKRAVFPDVIHSPRTALPALASRIPIEKRQSLRSDAEFTVRFKTVHTVGNSRRYASLHPQ